MLTWSSCAALASVGRASSSVLVSSGARGARLARRGRTFEPREAFDTGALCTTTSVAGIVLESDAIFDEATFDTPSFDAGSFETGAFETGALEAIFDDLTGGGVIVVVFSVAGGGTDSFDTGSAAFAFGAFGVAIDGTFDAGGAIDARFLLFVPLTMGASDLAFAIGVWRAVSSIAGSAFAGARSTSVFVMSRV